jgi:hypothetical protein
MCMFILIQQGRWKSDGWDSQGNGNAPLAPLWQRSATFTDQSQPVSELGNVST